MKKLIYLFLSFNLLLVVASKIFAASEKSLSDLKILHLSFHKGCINDFEEVCRELGLHVTSWYILGADQPKKYFDGVSSGNVIYNIGHDRANKVWEKHKDYFNQFDVIVTSDTAPLSRIFLQNGWKKPLIIWVCNRFDYHDGASLDCNFPDKEYYDLINKAGSQKNVKIIPYTDYEYIYAAAKGVNLGKRTIKPIGVKEKEVGPDFVSGIPKDIDKKQTIYVYPRMPENVMNYVLSSCDKLGLKTYNKTYKGPEDLKGFKGTIYYPYQFSNLAVFEDLQRGIIHFVPSEKFIKSEVFNKNPVICGCLGMNFEYCEWYQDQYKDLIIYFDSWQDLKYKIDTLDYDSLSKKIKEFGLNHRVSQLSKWQDLFDEIKRLFNS